MDTKTCLKCKRVKSLAEFSWRNKKKGTKHPWCKECFKEYDRKRAQTTKYKTDKRKRHQKLRKDNRKFIFEYLSNKKCVDCGESRIPCLQFDHVDEKHKRAVIGDMMHYSRRAIIEEIEKCEVRCANCHAIRTSKSQGWYSWA